MADKPFKGKISAKGTEITVLSQGNDDDYISLTDIARYKNSEEPTNVVANWLRNRNTVEFLGIWEQLYNPYFKPLEFEGFRKENPDKSGNMRDYATIEQLLVLANLENINALYIGKGMPQPERIVELNRAARTQLTALLENHSVKGLKALDKANTEGE